MLGSDTVGIYKLSGRTLTEEKKEYKPIPGFPYVTHVAAIKLRIVLKYIVWKAWMGHSEGILINSLLWLQGKSHHSSN